jgi:hypothetical protein
MCVFRANVTGDFGKVTGHFGNATERTGRQDWRCARHQPRGLCSPDVAGESMRAHRMNMRMIKDVLRPKFDVGFSHDWIAASLGISKGVVTKYVGLAGAAELDWASACDMDEGELDWRLRRAKGINRSRRLGGCEDSWIVATRCRQDSVWPSPFVRHDGDRHHAEPSYTSAGLLGAGWLLYSHHLLACIAGLSGSGGKTHHFPSR